MMMMMMMMIFVERHVRNYGDACIVISGITRSSAVAGRQRDAACH